MKSFESEGYVKYSCDHQNIKSLELPPEVFEQWDELNETRTHLHKIGLVGVYENGIGYGNLSMRYGSGFVISGTATGAKHVLTISDYCIVDSFDMTRNSVKSRGPVQASSESMTHGAVYESSPLANCVIHVHSRKIFDGMQRDCYPSTPKEAAYGTCQIALAITECVKASVEKTEGQIVLAGHDEGVIVYAANAKNALQLIINLYNKFGA